MAMFGGKAASVSAAKETPASWVTRGLAKGYGMFGMTEQEAWRRAQQLSTALQAVTPLGVADVAYQDTQNLMAGRKRDPLGVALAAIPGAPAAKKAAAKGGELAMDTASRMARAKAMGFHMDEPVYHETDKAFSAFKPQYGNQVWFTTDPATFGNNGAAGRGVVVEARLRHKKLAGWPEYDKYSVAELEAMGYDGARLGNDIVIFGAEKIRKPNARFDPAKRNSANLMAGVGGFGLLGAGFMPRDEQPQTGKVY